MWWGGLGGRGGMLSLVRTRLYMSQWELQRAEPSLSIQPCCGNYGPNPKLYQVSGKTPADLNGLFIGLLNTRSGFLQPSTELQLLQAQGRAGGRSGKGSTTVPAWEGLSSFPMKPVP